MNLSLMRNEMERFFRVFFTSSCGFGRPKKVCGETVAGVFFRPFAVVGAQIGEGKKKKLETMTMSGFRVLGFGIWSATSCQECMVDQLRT
jgi:hypothetical protein